LLKAADTYSLYASFAAIGPKQPSFQSELAAYFIIRRDAAGSAVPEPCLNVQDQFDLLGQVLPTCRIRQCVDQLVGFLLECRSTHGASPETTTRIVALQKVSLTPLLGKALASA